MFRRKAFALLLGGSALAGCQQLGLTSAAWLNDATILANGLSAIAPQLTGLVGIPANIGTLVQNALSSAAAFAQDLEGITDPTKAESTLNQVSQSISAALQLLQPYMSMLPPPFSIALTAAQVLLPVIMAVINPSAAASVRRPASAQMTPDQARMILKGAAGK
jgi:hypothetical protein